MNELILSATNGINPDAKITYNSTLHQKLLIEAYKLLKHQCFSGLEIPEMYSHLGSCETGDSWSTGKMTVGAYNEDLKDVVFGYSGATGEAATMSHFWDADAGDESTWYWPIPYNFHFKNAYQKARKYIYGDWDLRIGTPTLLSFAYNNIFDAYKYNEIYVTYDFLKGGTISPPVRIDQYDSPLISDNTKDYIIWEILGRLCHLIGDMAVPAHAHNDCHGGPTCAGDYYETMMADDLHGPDYLSAYEQGGILLDIDKKHDPLRYIFYTMNQISDYYPSYDLLQNKDGDGDKFYQSPGSSGDSYLEIEEFFTQGYGNQPVIREYNQFIQRMPEIIDVVVNMTIRAQASLLYWFVVESGLGCSAKPNLSLPLDDSTISNSSINFHWKPSIGITPITYTFQIATDSTFTDLQIEFTDIADTSITISNLSEVGTYFWRVVSSNICGTSPWSATRSFTLIPAVSVREEKDTYLIRKFQLEQNYPNPFNLSTKIPFYIGEDTKTILEVYNLQGQILSILVNQNLISGSYEVEFDASDLPSGIYYYRLVTNSKSGTKAMLLLK